MTEEKKRRRLITARFDFSELAQHPGAPSREEGESVADFDQRVSRWLAEILASHPGIEDDAKVRITYDMDEADDS